MGSNAEKNQLLNEAVQKLAGTYNKDIVSIVVCNVTAVDENARTCDCTPIGGDATTAIPAVQLMAEVNDGFLLLPTVDSTVIVGFSTRNTAFVLMYSDLDKAKLITATLTQFNDGSFGGLTKTQELKTQLDLLNAQLQAIITALTTWVVVPSDGGAALKAAAIAGMVGKAAGTFTAIENTRITQGI